MPKRRADGSALQAVRDERSLRHRCAGRSPHREQGDSNSRDNLTLDRGSTTEPGENTVTNNARKLSRALPVGLAMWLGVLQPACEACALPDVPPASAVAAPGSDTQTSITEQYARLVARDA
jgi:hypothetical protein